MVGVYRPPYYLKHTLVLSATIKVVGLVGKIHIIIDMFLNSDHPIITCIQNQYAIYYGQSHI